MKYIFKSKENDEMNHSAHLLGSSLSRVQGYPQDGWYWQMNEWMNEWMTRGDQALVSEACNFIFKRDFYTLTCTQREMKDARSCRISPNTPAVLPLSKPGFFLHTFPITMLCILSSGLGGLWTFYGPLLIKAAQPENLLSLEKKCFFS